MWKNTLFSRLIRAPPGYVGYEEGGSLTRGCAPSPYQIILFDEIEKAHPDIFNVLLQVLDEGQLTDGQGRTVDFRNTLILLTSNLGAETLLAVPEGKQVHTVRDKVMQEVQAAFRPEFSEPAGSRAAVPAPGSARYGPDCGYPAGPAAGSAGRAADHPQHDRSGPHWLAEEGYDPHYGARPLKRVLQRQIQNPLAEKMLAGGFADGDQIIIDVSDLEPGLLLQKIRNTGRGSIKGKQSTVAGWKGWKNGTHERAPPPFLTAVSGWLIPYFASLILCLSLAVLPTSLSARIMLELEEGLSLSFEAGNFNAKSLSGEIYQVELRKMGIWSLEADRLLLRSKGRQAGDADFVIQRLEIDGLIARGSGSGKCSLKALKPVIYRWAGCFGKIRWRVWVRLF